MQQQGRYEMALNMGNLTCCGVKEISELSTFETPMEVFKAFAGLTYLRRGPVYVETDNEYKLVKDAPQPFERFRYVIFSQAVKRATYGTAFAKFIEKYKLGTLQSTEFNINPNSGNYLKIWTWTVDHDACVQLLKAEGIAVPSRQAYIPATGQ